jgi:tetratricopeptide (TPR) repeat protein
MGEDNKVEETTAVVRQRVHPRYKGLLGSIRGFIDAVLQEPSEVQRLKDDYNALSNKVAAQRAVIKSQEETLWTRETQLENAGDKIRILDSNIRSKDKKLESYANHASSLKEAKLRIGGLSKRNKFLDEKYHEMERELQVKSQRVSQLEGILNTPVEVNENEYLEVLPREKEVSYDASFLIPENEAELTGVLGEFVKALEPVKTGLAEKLQETKTDLWVLQHENDRLQIMEAIVDEFSKEISERYATIPEIVSGVKGGQMAGVNSLKRAYLDEEVGNIYVALGKAIGKVLQDKNKHTSAINVYQSLLESESVSQKDKSQLQKEYVQSFVQWAVDEKAGGEALRQFDINASKGAGSDIETDIDFLSEAKTFLQEYQLELANRVKELRDNKDYVEAISAGKIIMQITPQNHRAAYFAGSAASASGNHIEAVRYLGLAVKINPGYRPAANKMKKLEKNLIEEMKSLRNQERFLESVELAKEYLNYKAEDFHGNYYAGTSLLKQGVDLLEAKKYLERAATIEPEHLYATRRLREVNEKLLLSSLKQ